ncbi:MAG: hypothetical protein Q4F95_15950 [Oscillospiraceae bacterium]|nr:hypothetical protein [Oscillospiraceae bacterium]
MVRERSQTMIIRYCAQRINDITDEYEAMVNRLCIHAKIMKDLSAGLDKKESEILKEEIKYLCSAADALRTHYSVLRTACDRYLENEARSESEYNG